MAMQLGVNTWTWVSPFRTEDARSLFPKIKEMGFDSVEVALEDPFLVDADETLRLANANGLSVQVCGAFGPGRDMSSDDPAVVNQAFDYIQQAVDFAQKVGSKVVCGPMYSAVGKARHVPPEVRRQERDRAMEGLRKAAEIAESGGVRLAVEPLNRFETDMINTALQARELVESVGSPAVGIHLDTFHMNIEEADVYEAVRVAGNRLYHVHASESNRGTPGAGLAAWDELARGLKDVNYQGAVVIETFTPEVKEIARAAAIWRPLAESQDELARNGLKFLRKLLEG